MNVAPDGWAIASPEQASALGLPSRPENYGLLMFEDQGRRWTWAGDGAVVAALEEHEGEVPDWDRHFHLEADGWPEAEAGQDAAPLVWRPRSS